jgi:hypothetical protein
MINNTSRERWERVKAKGLDQQFLQEMMGGLQCSRFEAQAILDKVHEIFEPLMEHPQSLQPGQIQLCVVDARVGPGTPLKEAAQRLVTLTLDAGDEDYQWRKKDGVGGLRQRRLCRIAEEAFQQGGVLTLEDIAAVFNCGMRTLVRDLAALRQRGIRPPLRSLVQDMGRAVSHRREIVKLWLEGREYSEIAQRSYHSVESVANYVEKFKRCAVLFSESYDLNTVGFLVRLSVPLAREFHQLWSEMEPVEHRRKELEERGQKNGEFWIPRRSRP